MTEIDPADYYRLRAKDAESKLARISESHVRAGSVNTGFYCRADGLSHSWPCWTRKIIDEDM